MTFPLGTVLLKAPSELTLKPLFFSVDVAVAEARPTTLGTVNFCFPLLT